MSINSFRDSLMITHFDSFRSIIEEINSIKADLKTQQRRVRPMGGTYTAYRMVKEIALPLSRIFNSRRYSHQRCLERFIYALQKISLLLKELAFYELDDLLSSFRHLYRKLFNMLPSGTVIQHELFDAEHYNNDSKKRTLVRGFLDWLQDYKLLGYQRRDIAHRMAYQPVQIVQQSIRFSRAT